MEIAGSPDPYEGRPTGRLPDRGADSPNGRRSRPLCWAILWADANWLLDAASLLVFVAVFGHRENPDGLLVAYGLCAGRHSNDPGRARDCRRTSDGRFIGRRPARLVRCQAAFAPWINPLPRGEKVAKQSSKSVGCLLSHVVPRVDAVAADVVGPVSPDHERVAVEILKIVSLGPQHQQWRP